MLIDPRPDAAEPRSDENEPRADAPVSRPLTVVIRPTALVVAIADEDGRVEERPAPDADEALEVLRTFGCEVVLAAAGDADALSAGDWLLTADLDDCRHARRLGARPILVGPGEPARDHGPDRPDRRADSPLRAALEIMTTASQPPDGQA
jgi:hypothetical protein